MSDAIDPVEQWKTKGLPFYRWLNIKIAGDFVPPSVSGIDQRLVSRIKTAYRLALDNFEGTGDSPWTTYSQWTRDVHDSLLDHSDDRIIKILRDPVATKLFHGYYSLAHDLGIDESSPAGLRLADWTIHQIVASLLRLAEATGAVRLWNPESADPLAGRGDYITEPYLERLLTTLDGAIGVRVEFPNPIPREFGLPSSRGIASYRAPQAIYQAWRIRELLRDFSPANALEIGAGMGRTAYYGTRLGIANYTIVDLPLANVAQAYFLGRALGENAIWLPGDPITAQAGRIRILTPAWLATTNETFGLVLNADSITEMDDRHATSYFRKISRHAAFFLSINHESNQLRVVDLPSKCGITARVSRYPYWLRKGYVEEIYMFDSTSTNLPCFDRSDETSIGASGRTL